MPRIYFDWAASAPCDPEAAETLSAALRRYAANPSSRHTSGKEARACLETCRNECADLLKTTPETVVTKRRQIHILSAPFEHPSVINPLFELKSSGHKVEFLKTTSEGVIDTDDLRRKLTPETALVCLMHTHNETGAVQPLSEAVQAVREFESGGKRIHFHCDAVQAGGKTAVDLTAADVDSASFSAHKFGGARGAGILFLKKPLQPLYLGGGQENGLRPGTENLPAVAAMTAALKNRNRCRDDETAAAREIRRKLTNAFSLRPEIVFPFPENGAEFSPYVMSIAVPGLPSEVAQRLFSDRGFDISSGSACSSNDAARKQKIKNPLGLPPRIAESVLRLSWGHTTSPSDADALINAFDEIIKEHHTLLRRSP